MGSANPADFHAEPGSRLEPVLEISIQEILL